MFFNFFVLQKSLSLFFPPSLSFFPLTVPRKPPKSVRSPLGLSLHLEYSFFRIINAWSFLKFFTEFQLQLFAAFLLVQLCFYCCYPIVWFLLIYTKRGLWNWPMVCLPIQMGHFDWLWQNGEINNLVIWS